MNLQLLLVKKMQLLNFKMGGTYKTPLCSKELNYTEIGISISICAL